jgi:hypothetical protein
MTPVVYIIHLVPSYEVNIESCQPVGSVLLVFLVFCVVYVFVVDLFVMLSVHPRFYAVGFVLYNL